MLSSVDFTAAGNSEICQEIIFELELMLFLICMLLPINFSMPKHGTVEFDLQHLHFLTYVEFYGNISPLCEADICFAAGNSQYLFSHDSM